MTGGCVVVIGKTGKNFAAGMSGGVAYVLDEESDLYMKLNKELVHVSEVKEKADTDRLRRMLEEHLAATGSEKAKEILSRFAEYLHEFKKIIPYDYEQITAEIAELEGKGLSAEQARIEAFYSLTGQK